MKLNALHLIGCLPRHDISTRRNNSVCEFHHHPRFDVPQPRATIFSSPKVSPTPRNYENRAPWRARMQYDGAQMRMRWVIVGLLFFATTINYLDRAILGVILPEIRDQFHFGLQAYGLIQMWFQLAYAGEI